jgi:tRNA A-37 threonylcarbamoyl transferase component Bud32
MANEKSCPICGKPVGESALEGLCPECMLKAGFPTGTEPGTAGPGGSSFVAPSVEEVRRLFPHLEVIEMIGRGGMGAVYKARQTKLDRLVALKILPPGIGDDRAFADRFVREAKALAKLNHPNIVTLYEFDQADGLFYFMMEFVDGVNLRQLLQAGRLAPREALAIVPQICDALQYAHDQGIVHRDIKPENVLLDRKGHVKVADFGVARLMGIDGEMPAGGGDQAASASVSLTEAGKVMGTPQYMAPEQKERPAEVDHRADIYSLGVVFYQMLTGELPGKRIEAPSSRMRGIHLDVRLDEVVLRALEKKPDLRYQQASVLKTDVETIAGSAPSQPPAARSQFAYFWEDVFPGCTASPKYKNRYIRFLENLFGDVTSSGAIMGFHLSLVGFIGFVALLAIIPGMRWCLPGLGFFPMLGLIGVAYIFEAAARSGADLSQTCRLPDPNSQRGRWRRRIFWLIVAGIMPPMFLFAVSLVVLGVGGGEKALEAATALQMALIFAKAIGMALGVSLIVWLWCRIFRKKSADGVDVWPRHAERLIAFAIFWPVLAVAASVVIWEFATARVQHAVDWGHEIPSLIGNGFYDIWVWAIIIWLICGVPGIGIFRKAVAGILRRAVVKREPEINDPPMRGTSASPKVFAYLALRLFLVGLLGTILLLAFSRSDALPFIFGGAALLLALVFGIISWRTRLGKGIVFSTLTIFLLGAIIAGLLSETIPNPYRAKRRARAEAEMAKLKEKIDNGNYSKSESVVVADRAAVVKQRQYNGEALLFLFGDMTNRWEPKHLDSLFAVTLESHLFGRGADWVISSAHGPMGYNLDTPAGLVKGHIMFHRSTPAPEADGSYVIAEFQPDKGPSLPIAVKLVADKPAKANVEAATRADQEAILNHTNANESASVTLAQKVAPSPVAMFSPYSGRIEGLPVYALTNALIKPRHVVLAEFQIVDERHSVSFTVSQLSYYFISAQDTVSDVSAALSWRVENVEEGEGAWRVVFDGEVLGDRTGQIHRKILVAGDKPFMRPPVLVPGLRDNPDHGPEIGLDPKTVTWTPAQSQRAFMTGTGDWRERDYNWHSLSLFEATDKQGRIVATMRLQLLVCPLQTDAQQPGTSRSLRNGRWRDDKELKSLLGAQAPSGTNEKAQTVQHTNSVRTIALRHMLDSQMAEELRSVLSGKPGTEAKPSEDNLSLTVTAPPAVLTRVATFIAIQDWPQKVGRGINCEYRRDTVENAARSFFYACSTEDIPCLSTLLSPAVLAQLKGTNWDPFAILDHGKVDTNLIRQLRGNWEGKESALQKLVAAWNKYPLRQLRQEPGIAMGFDARSFATVSFEDAPEDFTQLSFVYGGNGNYTNGLVIDTLPPWFGQGVGGVSR